MNVSKTKIIVFSKAHVNANLTIHGEAITQATSLKYLGATVNNLCDSKKEVKARIEQAKAAFINMRSFFTKRELGLELRVRMLRCYIFLIFLYGCESWTLASKNPLKSSKCTFTDGYYASPGRRE